MIDIRKHARQEFIDAFGEEKGLYWFDSLAEAMDNLTRCRECCEELAEALADLANRADNLVEAAPEAGSTWGYLVSDVFRAERDARAALARLEGWK